MASDPAGILAITIIPLPPQATTDNSLPAVSPSDSSPQGTGQTSDTDNSNNTGSQNSFSNLLDTAGSKNTSLAPASNNSNADGHKAFTAPGRLPQVSSGKGHHGLPRKGGALLIARMVSMVDAQTKGQTASVENTSSTQPLSSTDNDLLNLLQQLLQNLIQLLSGLQKTGAQNTNVQDTPDTSSPQQQQTGTSDDKRPDSLADILAQLLAVLSQISQQPDAASIDAQMNSMSVTTNGGGTQSVMDVLTELAQALDSVVNGNTDNNATQAADNKNSLIPGNSTFAAIVNALLQSGIGNNAPVSGDADTDTAEIPSDTNNKSPSDDKGTPVNVAGSVNTNTNTNVNVNVDANAMPLSDNTGNNTQANNNTPFDSGKAFGNNSSPQDSPGIQLPAPPGGNFITQLQNTLSQIFTSIEPKDTKHPSAGDDASQNNLPPVSNVNTPAIVNGAQQTAGNNFLKFTNTPPPNTPVSDQVLVQIKNSVDTGASQIRIQLEPESLGKVDVQMVTSADGKTGVTITADNRQTLTMLQNEARALESALNDIGLKTNAGGLSFNLREQGQNNNSYSGSQNGYTRVASIDSEEDSNVGTIIASYNVSVQEGLDIRV